MQINENAIQEFQKFNIEYILNEKLSNHSTFKIGGMAAMFCKLKTDLEISSAIKICKEFSLKYFILGKGSNVLFKDEGFDGVILNIENVGINFTDESVTVSAGTPLATLCKAVHEKALTGLEFAYGIPGSVGGAVFMNAGAYGGEINDVIFSVKCISQDGTEKVYDKNELELGYRTSIFEKTGECILNATFKLKIGDKKEILQKMQQLAQCRADKQPLNLPSAGSTFKRPEGAFAGALIEQCGLKGYTVGGAQISEKHCGFVVNIGNATCKDVLQLTDDVSNVVKEKTGFLLQKEIKIVL